MLSLSHENQTNFTKIRPILPKHSISKSRYFDVLLSIHNDFFEQMVDTVDQKELQLNQTNISASFLNLNVSVLLINLY